MFIVTNRQMAEWIRMPLGTKAGLSPGHMTTVLHGDPPPPPQKGGTHPIFGPRLL